MANPILSLSTKKVRKSILIDDVTFELREMQELSMVEQHQFQARALRMKEGRKAFAELSGEQIADLSKTIDDILTTCLPGIASKIGLLTDAQKLDIVNVFLEQTAATAKTIVDAVMSSTASANSADSSEDRLRNGSEVLVNT